MVFVVLCLVLLLQLLDSIWNSFRLFARLNILIGLYILSSHTKRRSEYFPTFQCTKRVKLNLLIPLQKFKNDTFKLFLHIYRSQNMQFFLKIFYHVFKSLWNFWTLCFRVAANSWGVLWIPIYILNFCKGINKLSLTLFVNWNVGKYSDLILTLLLLTSLFMNGQNLQWFWDRSKERVKAGQWQSSGSQLLMTVVY